MFTYIYNREQTTVMSANVTHFPMRKVFLCKSASSSPRIHLTFSSKFSVTWLLGSMMPTMGGMQLLTGGTTSWSAKVTHWPRWLLPLGYLLAAPRYSQSKQQHCSQTHTINDHLKVLETGWQISYKEIRGELCFPKYKWSRAGRTQPEPHCTEQQWGP